MKIPSGGVRVDDIHKLVEVFETDVQRREADITTQDSEREQKNTERIALEAEIAATNAELTEATRYESPNVRLVSQAMNDKRTRLRERIDSLKRQLRGE